LIIGHACTLSTSNHTAEKIFTSASCGEAVFQMWWRSVHKSRYNLATDATQRVSVVWKNKKTDTGHWTPETGHIKWFYILSNACIALDRQLVIETKC